jgi:myo-inositol 2-dehydrogenase/D-chiro-inositol 1-dehydrogenase
MTAMTETFIKERTHTQTGKQPVRIDDAGASLGPFQNGSRALRPRATRATGAYTSRSTASMPRRAGTSISTACSGSIMRSRAGARLARHPLTNATIRMKHCGCPPADRLRAHLHPQFADFVQGLGSGTPTPRPSATATDCVTDAILKSAATRQWETVSTASVKVGER